jgi:hypothetical protein
LSQRLNRIDGYSAFLEQRYAGEVFRRFGVGIESPVDSALAGIVCLHE